MNFGRSSVLSRALRGNGELVRHWGPFFLGLGSFTWWVATLFMVGSALFAIGTVVAVSSAPTAAGTIYFVGSVFFTAAGFGQLLSAANEGHFDNPRWFAWRRELADWRASAIQSFGTLCFNVSTAFALVETLTVDQVNRLVWSPDFFGSIAFLWSSWIALSAVRHSWHGHPRRGATWASAALNMLGSIAFGWSALGAYVIPDTGELANALAANAGTFIGAICFFVAAWLVWPEAAKLAEAERQSEVSTPLQSTGP